MTSRKRILCVIGTRPEVIKMAPVVLALKGAPWAGVRVLTTAQHRHLLDQALAQFGIQPDIDLDIMQAGQSLAELTSRLTTRLDKVLEVEQPDMVIAQGDTTTVLMTALCCFYRRIPFAHVEAGLRTGNRYFPFPEEMNRVIAGYLSSLHFAPTQNAYDNLMRENIDPDTAVITGNTVIDALHYMIERPAPLPPAIDANKRLLLVTAHRRENFGKPFEEICRALRELADRYEDVQIYYPVHPNPNVHGTAHNILNDHPRVVLTQPIEYATLVAVMNQAYLILTDSGGIQEEAPALAKPVLVLRDETERPEAMEAGVVKLVGPHYQRIIDETARLLNDGTAYAAMAKGVSPYGDGQAARRITQAIRDYFHETALA